MEGHLAAVPLIGVVSGVEGPEAQRCLDAFGERHPELRIAGIVERRSSPTALRRTSRLFSLSGGHSFPIFQELGAAAKGCAILPSGLIEATALVCNQIEQGCDVVVLSKFGKLEAEAGSGLIAAFAAAIEAGVPVLTVVPEKFAQAWDRFAAPLYTHLSADPEAIDRWWAQVRVPLGDEGIEPLQRQGLNR